MTILPQRERNKRRLEQRDQDSSQQLAQQNSNGALEVQTITSHTSSSGQHQVDPPLLGLSQNIGHSLNHSHFGGHNHGHHQPQRHNNSCNALKYNHTHRTDNTHTTRAQAQAALAVDTKSWKCPPALRASSDEKYIPPYKKSKRSKVKSKHGHGGPYDYSTHPHDNHSSPHSKSTKIISASATTASPYGSFISKTHTGSTVLQQSRQILIPSTATIATGPQHSPKILGGAQQKVGKGCRPKSPESDVNSGDEYQTASSPGGCNSEDEHVPTLQAGHTEELETTFELTLKKDLGLDIRQMEMDGSCLFRAIADQVYGDQGMHDLVRRQCIDYMAKNSDHFSQYVTEDFNTYLHRKRQLGCHGNHIEVQALSEMFSRPIEVYQYELKPMNIFHGSYTPESACPIRISYHRNTHYNSLVDPEKPTVGVGLGLSDFKPRMVEKNLVAEAQASSENYQIEQAMLDDKIRETDWEITDEAINEQVARESYTQWLQDCQKQKRRAPACTVTGPSCSWGPEEPVNWVEKLSPTGSPSRSHAMAHSPKSEKEKLPNTKGTGGSKKSDLACGGEQASSSASLDLSQQANADLDNVYSYNANVNENEALARAIAESQQDYINQVLKK